MLFRSMPPSPLPPSPLPPSPLPPSPLQVCYYIRQAASALEYLASQGVVHGDIKPSNLFLSSSMQICIGDFGLSLLAGTCAGVSGTPNYIAPELLTGKKVSAMQCKACPCRT